MEQEHTMRGPLHPAWRVGTGPARLPVFSRRMGSRPCAARRSFSTMKRRSWLSATVATTMPEKGKRGNVMSQPSARELQDTTRSHVAGTGACAVPSPLTTPRRPQISNRPTRQCRQEDGSVRQQLPRQRRGVDGQQRHGEAHQHEVLHHAHREEGHHGPARAAQLAPHVCIAPVLTCANLPLLPGKEKGPEPAVLRHGRYGCPRHGTWLRDS